MVSNTLLLHIHQRLKEILSISNNQLFAGLSIITVGDLYQLPPIRRKFVFEEYKNNVYNLSHPWLLFKMIELTKNMRQKDDQQFTELLNRFRIASQTDDDIQCIQSRLVHPKDSDYPVHALHIFAENAPVDKHNNEHLQHLTTPLHKLKAIDQYPPHVTKQDIDRMLTRGRSETGGLDSEILVKENCRVMLTTNIDINDRLINGQMGTIKKIAINENTNKPSVLYIKFDDAQAGIKSMEKCTDAYARQNGAVPIQPVLARIKVRPGKPSSPEIQRLQFPITLAWTCTVHKVQGLTVNEIVVSFELNRQNHFNYVQIYVALSRARSLQGLHVTGKIENKHVKANPKVHAEYQRLRQQADKFSTIPILHDVQTLKVCLLNIRSLQKHSIDIKYDLNLTKCDILALTETQLLPHHTDGTIRQTLQPYTLHRQDHPTDKYSSLAICTKQNVHMLRSQYIPTINGLKFTVSNLHTNNTKTLLLIYRKNDSSIFQYVENINNIINTNVIDIILGDFNINYFNESSIRSLRDTMNSHGYVQIVDKPTFISAGSLLDQVYVKQSLRNNTRIEVTSVYYSDHDAVNIVMKE